jgi:hypothetical protein
LFIPTGGVEIDEDNIRGWFKSGVCAVGMGSRLISKEVLAGEKYELLYDNTLLAHANSPDCHERKKVQIMNLSKDNLQAIRTTGLVKPGKPFFRCRKRCCNSGPACC